MFRSLKTDDCSLNFLIFHKIIFFNILIGLIKQLYLLFKLHFWNYDVIGEIYVYGAPL